MDTLSLHPLYMKVGQLPLKQIQKLHAWTVALISLKDQAYHTSTAIHLLHAHHQIHIIN